jgi:hypothetical protein
MKQTNSTVETGARFPCRCAPCVSPAKKSAKSTLSHRESNPGLIRALARLREFDKDASCR